VAVKASSHFAAILSDGSARLLHASNGVNGRAVVGPNDPHLAERMKLTKTVRVPDEVIVDVQAFSNGLAALTKSGKVFTMGTNRYELSSQNHFLPDCLMFFVYHRYLCGAKQVSRSQDEWRQLTFGESDVIQPFILQISCSNEHGLACDRTGQVYAWGFASEGRLGLGTEAEMRAMFPFLEQSQQILHSPQVILGLRVRSIQSLDLTFRNALFPLRTLCE